MDPDTCIVLSKTLQMVPALRAQIMVQPESVVKSDEWMLAANESFTVDDIRQWVQKQTDSQACCLPQANFTLSVSPHTSFTSDSEPDCEAARFPEYWVPTYLVFGSQKLTSSTCREYPCRRHHHIP